MQYSLLCHCFENIKLSPALLYQTMTKKVRDKGYKILRGVGLVSVFAFVLFTRIKN